MCSDGSTIRVPVYARGCIIVAYATVDAEDGEWALSHRWRLVKGYARRSVKVNGEVLSYLLHRELLGLKRGDGLEVDHIDRDRLNNRRSNLRILSKAENGQNRKSKCDSVSRYRGVSWNSKRKQWYATVTVNGRTIWLGSYDDETVAASVARSARLRLLPYSHD